MKTKDFKYDVLKANVVNMNEKLSVFTISYQNTDILKRGKFRDDEIGVISSNSLGYCAEDNILHILGTNKDEDLKVIIIDHDKAMEIIGKVNQVNEKYGILKKSRLKNGKRYWYFVQNLELRETTERRGVEDRLRYECNNYFECPVEAQKMVNKIKDMLRENSIVKEEK